jgi:hypothetical protein
MFQGVIGGTFDATVTLYESAPGYVQFGPYDPTFPYPKNAVVVASDSSAYVSLAPNTGIDPVSNGQFWLELTPVDLTGWSASFVCNSASPTFTLTSTTGDGITLGGAEGTITVSATTQQTEDFTAAPYPCYLSVTDTDSNVYYPVQGQIFFRTALPPVLPSGCC